MLRSTFCHLTGIGPISENALWRAGCREWGDLREGRGTHGLPRERLVLWQRELDRSEESLRNREPGFFSRRLPSGEAWRIAPEFRREIAYLDIETTGLSPYEGIVTVVAVHGGGATRSFVAEDDLEELPAYLRRFPILCTFNGRTFDVPFLQARFPEMTFPETHLDLQYILYRLGQAGGLKRIEERLGVTRDSGLKGVDGLEAVRLWHAHRAGKDGALDRLIEYNRADTVNLEPLLAYATRELTRRTLGSFAAARVNSLSS